MQNEAMRRFFWPPSDLALIIKTQLPHTKTKEGKELLPKRRLSSLSLSDAEFLCKNKEREESIRL